LINLIGDFKHISGDDGDEYKESCLYREPGELETGKIVFGRHSRASGGKPQR
jgi:hypothetical protein